MVDLSSVAASVSSPANMVTATTRAQPLPKYPRIYVRTVSFLTWGAFCFSLLQGHDGAHGTRSRTWRSDSAGGGGGASGSSPRGGWGGSVEDAEALIGLARRRVGWGVEAEEGDEGGAGGGAGGEAGDGVICVSLPHMLSK